jgi:hypothetical protein
MNTFVSLAQAPIYLKCIKIKAQSQCNMTRKKKSKITDEEEMNIIHMIIYRKSKSIHGETVKISK